MYLSPATCSKGKSSRLGDFLGRGARHGETKYRERKKKR